MRPIGPLAPGRLTFKDGGYSKGTPTGFPPTKACWR